MYKIIEEYSKEDLQRKVVDMISNKWKPLGGVSVCNEIVETRDGYISNAVFYQAMVNSV